MMTQSECTLQCCQAARDTGAVFLQFSFDAIYESEGQEGHKPTWQICLPEAYHHRVATDGVRKSPPVVTHCPFCGTPVPEIVPRETTNKICRVIDGGYYCDTCGERLHACRCMPPEYAWTTKP